MNKMSFPLKLRMPGEGAADLQDGLLLVLDRGVFRLSDAERKALEERLHAERNKNTCDPVASDLVGSFQKPSQLEPSGAVEERTGYLQKVWK